MVSLVDVAPLREEVPIRDGHIEVRGISARALAALMHRFPEIRQLMGGQDVKLTADRLMVLVPDAVAAIIAAGCDKPGDKKHEDAAAELSLEEQAELLDAILRLTMPSGVGPFLDKVTGLLGALGVDASDVGGKAAATNSPPASTAS